MFYLLSLPVVWVTLWVTLGVTFWLGFLHSPFDFNAAGRAEFAVSVHLMAPLSDLRRTSQQRECN
jgi:hypothetical protein